MTKFLALIFFTVFATSANAALSIFYQDAKLPTQVMTEHQNIAAPTVGNANLILSAAIGPTGAGVVRTYTTGFLAQPDVPRNITVQPGSSAGSLGFGAILAGNVVVSGTDFFGRAITEAFPITAAQTTLQTGNLAFKTITAVTFPAEQTGFSATWSVGTGAKLGLKRCMARAGDVVSAELNGVREVTFPTGAASVAGGPAGRA